MTMPEAIVRVAEYAVAIVFMWILFGPRRKDRD